MQKHKPSFGQKPPLRTTLCDSQTCLRTTDLHEFGDRTHRIVFEMLGLFSFEDWTLQQTFRFWLSFIQRLNLEPDTITVHPDKMEEWTPIWRNVGYLGKIISDEQCLWSDGSIGGFCTEMYIDDIEIGNIVNPLGHSIDCGFGLERLVQVMGYTPPTPSEHLLDVLDILSSQGLLPSGKGTGSVVRQILKKGLELGIPKEQHPWLQQLQMRLLEQKRLYERLRRRHMDKDSTWWYQTHGIEVTLL